MAEGEPMIHCLTDGGLALSARVRLFLQVPAVSSPPLCTTRLMVYLLNLLLT